MERVCRSWFPYSCKFARRAECWKLLNIAGVLAHSRSAANARPFSVIYFKSWKVTRLVRLPKGTPGPWRSRWAISAGLHFCAGTAPTTAAAWAFLLNGGHWMFRVSASCAFRAQHFLWFQFTGQPMPPVAFFSERDAFLGLTEALLFSKSLLFQFWLTGGKYPANIYIYKDQWGDNERYKTKAVIYGIVFYFFFTCIWSSENIRALFSQHIVFYVVETLAFS